MPDVESFMPYPPGNRSDRQHHSKSSLTQVGDLKDRVASQKHFDRDFMFVLLNGCGSPLYDDDTMGFLKISKSDCIKIYLCDEKQDYPKRPKQEELKKKEVAMNQMPDIKKQELS